MIDISKKCINKVLQDKDVKRIDKSCSYYPCHSEVYDCTWCFCPFYPCYSIDTQGTFNLSKDRKAIWSCKDCTWIHKYPYSRQIFKKLKKTGKRIEEISREDLIQIFQETKQTQI